MSDKRAVNLDVPHTAEERWRKSQQCICHTCPQAEHHAIAATQQPRRFTPREREVLKTAVDILPPYLSVKDEAILRTMFTEASAISEAESAPESEIAPRLPSCRKHAVQRCPECAPESEGTR